MKGITYGSRQLNKLLDDTLMNKHSFASETLMEIAGLAVAQISHQILLKKSQNKVCVLVGPGNNGGDGLVAARHLRMMNHEVDVVTFKKLEGKNGNYLKLCHLNGIPSKDAGVDFGEPENEHSHEQFKMHLSQRDLIIDAVFGFPFTGEMKSPYKFFIPLLKHFESKILSVDIPSGWDANEGNINNLFTPMALVSLGMPKKCSQNFQGYHYLGGRFVPEAICQELGIVLPPYESHMLYTKL